MTERRTAEQERFAEQARTFAKKSWYDLFFDAVALRKALISVLRGTMDDGVAHTGKTVREIVHDTAYLEESDEHHAEALLPTIITLVVEPDGDGFHAWCPELKGLHAPGITQDEALANARDAAVAYLESVAMHGDAIAMEEFNDHHAD